ncbi:hypothetical protein P167DRAFT_262725 [Morchella conica CCBAS932]|uniref:Uncharacterized protein n=1 Tax=Morchella conica CCBAS932 TaxID=1392247 RepID=A0A3N4L512_9PEZI|nr:hypothetical protein P167DRAFT_262725 [Morchella conica CCBAS932]
MFYLFIGHTVLLSFFFLVVCLDQKKRLLGVTFIWLQFERTSVRSISLSRSVERKAINCLPVANRTSRAIVRNSNILSIVHGFVFQVMDDSSVWLARSQGK